MFESFNYQHLHSWTLFIYLACLTHRFPPLSPSSEGAAMASGSSEVAASQEATETAEECSGK